MTTAGTRIEPALIRFDEQGSARSGRYDDIFHPADAIGQSRHVFLGGNSLPARWARRRAFTIVETGFGLGLNFLTTWKALRASEAPPDRLHFISAEAHPCRAPDLERACARWPCFRGLARELLNAWPPLVGGFHRLHFDHGRVTLTLLLGDAATMLAELEAAADAFYLDGFAPDRNPAMWSDDLFHQIGRLAAPDATAASWTVAGAVRARLAAAGFTVEKRPGFGDKRQMLAARYSGSAAERGTGSDAVFRPARTRQAVIVGAGLAGTACAERLTVRGWQVDLIERHASPAQEGSGNRCGVLRPVVNLPDNANARLSRAAYLHALRHVRALGLGPSAWGDPGVLHVAASAAEGERMANIAARHALPAELMSPVSAPRAGVLAGHAVAGEAWWFPQGAWADPGAICAAQIALRPDLLRRIDRSEAFRLEGHRGVWRVLDAQGRLLAQAPVVILANAFDAHRLLPALAVPLARVRGQVSMLPALAGRRLDTIVCGDGYVAPLPEGGYCVGATFDAGDDDPAVREADHARNLARVERLLPGFARALAPQSLAGRVGYRTTTPDRLPACGAASPNLPGLYVFTGLGARGLVWAPLCAELLAAQLEGEPLPIERGLVTAIDPQRSPRPRLAGNRRRGAQL